jgi:hypothetical protein
MSTTPNRWLPAVTLPMQWILHTFNVEAQEIIRAAAPT